MGGCLKRIPESLEALAGLTFDKGEKRTPEPDAPISGVFPILE